MRVIDEKTTVYRLYDSVEEQVDFADSVSESRCEDHGDPTHRSFVGRQFSDWGDAKRATRTAWPQGLEVLERMIRDLDDTEIDQPRSRRRRTRFAEDDGYELDYDRLRSGQPYWRTSRRENTRGPATVTVLVDVGANCRVNHEDILWRGAAAIALTKRLEEAGYRVELWSVSLTERVWAYRSKNPITVMDSVCLKRPGDPIDESTLISAVAGWFYRTVGFRAWCSGSHSIHRGLGHHRAPMAKELDHVSRDENRTLIAGCFTYSSAVDHVRQAISNLKTE